MPISHKAVDVALLSAEERSWFNEYNAWVREQLQGLVPAYAVDYLVRETAPL